MKKLFLAFTFLALVFGLAACGEDTPPTAPTISGVGAVTLTVGDSFDPLAGVSANDAVDGSLTGEITVSGEVNTAAAGTYTLTYRVENAAGLSREVSRVVTVREATTQPGDGDFILAQGEFDFKFAPVEVKNVFFGAAEKWLLNNGVGGIPVFANSSFTLFSPRIQLPVEQFVPVMGFGTIYGSMSQDDSTVRMDDGRFGQAGSYTYRSAFTFSPTTLNQWTYDDSVSADTITLFLDSLYYFNFNQDFDGFDLLPSMASGLPTAVDGENILGTTVSNTWRVPLRQDLKWTYHPDTDTSSFPAGHENITAEDFIDTFKLAIDNLWFRAVSGGGDFMDNSQRIVGAREYRDGEVDWDAVGLRVVDDYTLEFEFVPLMSDWDVSYWLSSFVMTPINLHLYEAEGDRYGTSQSTVAFNGRYRLDRYEVDRILRYSKNPNFHQPNRTFYTNIVYQIIPDPNLQFEMFLAGELDVGGVPTARFDEFASHPELRFAPGASTFRINVNALQTPELQEEAFPGSGYTPEPIIGYRDFLMAMYFSIDREEVAYNIMRTAEPQQFHFTSAYLVDPQGGVSFRDTDLGPLSSQGLSPSTFGYNEDAARALWLQAINQAVEDGFYSPGDTIEIELVIQAASPAQALLGDWLKDQWERLFVAPELNIDFELTITPAPFPQNYFNYILPGTFDLGTGAIAGGTLDAAGFLAQYRTDNAGGFTLNWGFETNVAEIPVEYTIEGVTYRQIWSFDAIHRALTSGVEVRDGQEVKD
jgi:ABC-type oligopeptide transport system substrate-binding subunit